MPPVGFEPTIDLSRGAAVELRLRPRGYWDRQFVYIIRTKLLMLLREITDVYYERHKE